MEPRPPHGRLLAHRAGALSLRLRRGRGRHPRRASESRSTPTTWSRPRRRRDVRAVGRARAGGVPDHPSLARPCAGSTAADDRSPGPTAGRRARWASRSTSRSERGPKRPSEPAGIAWKRPPTSPVSRSTRWTSPPAPPSWTSASATSAACRPSGSPASGRWSSGWSRCTRRTASASWQCAGSCTTGRWRRSTSSTATGTRPAARGGFTTWPASRAATAAVARSRRSASCATSRRDGNARRPCGSRTRRSSGSRTGSRPRATTSRPRSRSSTRTARSPGEAPPSRRSCARWSRSRPRIPRCWSAARRAPARSSSPRPSTG